MGGRGSGGNNRRSDEEKIARGTFRSDRSEAVYDAASASKVVTGPWLETIPDPTLPLGPVGLQKYNELARLLHGQNKLTLVTQMHAELAARQFQKVHKITVNGGEPSASDMTQLNRSLDALRIAEHAPSITNPGGVQNRFADSGFSNRRNSPIRLRGPASARS